VIFLFYAFDYTLLLIRQRKSGLQWSWFREWDVD